MPSKSLDALSPKVPRTRAVRHLPIPLQAHGRCMAWALITSAKFMTMKPCRGDVIPIVSQSRPNYIGLPVCAQHRNLVHEQLGFGPYA